MVLFEDIAVQVNLQALMDAIGGGRNIPGMRDDAQWACETVERFAKAKAIIDILPIDSFAEDRVAVCSEQFPEPVELAIGKRGVHLLEGASSVQIGFVTLGLELEDLNADLQRHDKMMKQYLLDTAAILALYDAGRRVNQHVEGKARQKRWGLSCRLSPGDLRAWELSGQCVLAQLVPVAQIGVEVKSSGLLYPLKSASSLIGLGPGLKAARVGTICQWCSNQKTCPIKMSKLDD